MIQKSTYPGPSFTKLRAEKQELRDNFDKEKDAPEKKKSGNSEKSRFQFAPFLANHSICQFKDTQVYMRDKKKKKQNSQRIYRYPKGMRLRVMQESLIAGYLDEMSRTNQNRKATFNN